MRNSTRMTPPPGSLAVAASGTAAPEVNDWLAVGEVSETCGGVLPPEPTVKVTAAVVVLSAGEPLSTAVAVAVWLPFARPLRLKLYGEDVSVDTNVPSTRNSTRATAPPGSLAVAVSGTAEPDAKFWLAEGEVSDTCGAVLPPPPTVNVTAAVVVLSAGVPLSTAVAVTLWLPFASPVALKLYGDDVSLETSVPSTRNSTRATAPPGSLAVAASGTVAPAANAWLAVGEVSATCGAVLVGVLPTVQAVPLSVNAVGGLLVPVKVPLKPTVNTPLLAIDWFQAALLAMVSVALPAGWLKDTGQPFCSRWPLGKLNTRLQPLVMAGPVLRMSMLAPKPLPPVQLGQV